MTASSIVAALNTTCELCGAADWRPHTAAVQDYLGSEVFDLERCGACGLVVTCPMPPQDQLARYYPPRYRSDRQKQTGGWRTRRRAAMLARHFPRGFRGRLLDLGCGTGAFAIDMQRRGWDVAVTELDDTVLESMRSRGIEAKRPDDALRDGFARPFDAITCWHVLEDVPRPLALSKWSRDNLAPGGIFQATVPNLASWQAQRYGRNWMHLDVPRHLYHFTPATLKKLLDKAGLHVVGTSTLALEYDLFGVVQSSLNGICTKPNVLFERLTARGERPPADAGDVARSYALAPFLAGFGLVHTLLAAAAGRGGTLTATCRR